MVNGAQRRSTLRRISKAKSSIISCIGHKYVYVYELGCRIVGLKSWYLLVFSVRYSETTFINETLRNLQDAFTVHSSRRVHSLLPTMTRLGARFKIRLDPVKTSHCKIMWSLEATRFLFKIIPSLWNLRGTSAAVLPRRLCQNFQNDGKT